MKGIAHILQQAGIVRQDENHPANILKALLALQGMWGCVPRSAIPEIAATLGVTEAEAAGVLSYFPILRTEPPGRNVIRVCRGESCVAHQSGQVLKALQTLLNIQPGETTSDGRFTLEEVYCVGCCAVPPNVMIDETVWGRVLPSSVSLLLEEYR